MFAALRNFSDRVLGRGDAAITVPVMDGALKANRVLDEARIVAELPGIDDIASDGVRLWASAGSTLYRFDGRYDDGSRNADNAAPVAVRHFDADISAIAVSRGGTVAVAVGGSNVVVMQMTGGAWNDIAQLEQLAGTRLVGVNALAFDGDDQLVFTEGSQRHGPADWCRDLMELGRTGRAGRWNFRSGASSQLASGLHHAYGVLARDGAVLVSESWRHRVVVVGTDVGAGTGVSARTTLPAGLPGYPSRMSPAPDGGFWLACFVCRTQLVEFVLREPAYRQRMLAEIDPRYWIAPALSSGKSFLEPLQGAGVKTMGVMKPWAPPRSYGLVLRIGRDGQVMHSFHSQVDGRHHGITGVAEHQGMLFVASKGSGRLLSVATAAGVSA